MIKVSSSGDWEKTRKFLRHMVSGNIYPNLEKYGQMGVDALEKSTPIRSKKTAGSWSYKIVRNKGKTSIEWYNTNINDGANVAILLQYGHATGTGGYVRGKDYINPAMKPVFDIIAERVWADIKRA